MSDIPPPPPWPPADTVDQQPDPNPVGWPLVEPFDAGNAFHQAVADGLASAEPVDAATAPIEGGDDAQA